MTILAQHGYGKKKKIEQGIKNGSIEGVIISPRDESPTNLAAFLASIASEWPSTERLVDPQLYVGTILPVNAPKLLCYPYYRERLTPVSFSPNDIRFFVSESLKWQSTLDISAVLSPTVMVDDLSNQWAQISMMLAQETVAQHDGTKPLLVSLVIGEDALRQRNSVHRWLDDLTTLEVDGFYLVVRRSSESYRQHYEPEVLTSLLHICYSLAELNQYRVFSGYTDMATMLLHAVGITGSGAGWYANLRQFNLRRFQPSSGGRQPRSRYSSSPLLNVIYMTELDVIYRAGQVADVLSDTPFDRRFNGPRNPENLPWLPDDAALHHWQTLAKISRWPVGSSVGDRLDQAHNRIMEAIALYAQINNLVPFTTETGSTHLDQWLDALNRFRSETAV